MSRLQTKLICLLGACLSTNAFGISRVGNLSGRMIGDTQTNVMVTVPLQFLKVSSLSPTALRLEKIDLLGEINRGYEHIDASDFAEVYPELVSLSRSELKARLNTAPWLFKKTLSNCVDVYEQSSDTAVTTVITWGLGGGFVFARRNVTSAANAVESMLQSLAFPAEACQWN